MVAIEEDGSYERNAIESALRRVQIYITKLGYRCGKRSNNLTLKDSIRLKSCCYLRELLRNGAVPPHERLREVYLDDSYIRQYYNRFDDSFCDPSDEQDVQVGKILGGG